MLESAERGQEFVVFPRPASPWYVYETLLPLFS